MENNKKYDLIASLGANCSAAHNILIRNLRYVALPFDWTYIKDEKSYIWLSENLENKLKNLCLWENLQEITEDHSEWNTSHLDRTKYIDTLSGFRFVNHFNKTTNKKAEYDRVYPTIRKRCERFFEIINSSENVLLVISTSIHISDQVLFNLKSKFQELFPNCSFDFVYMNFCAENDELLNKNNIKINNIRRDLNLYDYTNTNFEWNWLDEIKLKKKAPSKDHKLLSMNLFGYKFKLWFSFYKL